MTTTYTYPEILAASEKVRWRVEDLIGGDKRLDYSKPFLPESLARCEALDFLTEGEQLVLNQLRGHNYLYLFGLVEEFILPFVLDHARPELDGDDAKTRALLAFAGEEAKHIDLFKRFRRHFLEGFGVSCDVIGPPEAIAEAVLGHSQLGVAITILHIEWMTQRHFTESIHDDRELDPCFKSLLRHHWMEEAQHAKLDTLMVEALAAQATDAERIAAFEEYLGIGGMLDEGLKQQVLFDLDAFQRATGRTLTDAEKERFVEVQHQAMRWTFLGSGMSHPNVLQTLGRMAPAARAKLEEVAPHFS